MLALPPMPEVSLDPTPRWLVSNGATTVGPVATDLLMRGYLGGRIPEHCQVRELRWDVWRPLAGIREIGGLKRRLERGIDECPLNLQDATARLPVTRDVGELLASCLELAARALEANAGLIHRHRSPLALPVTSAIFGADPERLGEVLPPGDPGYGLAQRGRGLCGSPQQGLAHRLVAERLTQDAPMISVAMTPIVASGRLVALLELGRTDHPFRADDASALAEFAAHVARRIG
jgi:hypothetical protein